MSGDTPRRFLVEHLSDFRYQEPAQGSLMLLRLQPREDGGQQVSSFALEIDPPTAPVTFADAFGNVCHLFNIHRAHEHTAVRSRSDIETAPAPDLPDRMEKDAWDALAEIAAPLDHFEFLTPSRFARPSPALEAFAEANGLRRGDDPLSSLLEMSHGLHTAFRYEPGSTEVDSPIEHILETGSGVCQDYTHVMIAIARSWGVPSRYVSGYIHREGVPGEQTPEGASHAWAEFLLPDLGWLGIDPTNDTLADHRHVRVAVGRDYADAAPTRGAVFGGGETRLDVRVRVSEAGEPEPAIAPRPERPFMSEAAPTIVPQPAADQ
ncbi:MAG: transglutaminase family protein [Rhodospirillales bacterium]|nr:transglutaminase family protein [Rhodospirillales bacterium]MDE0378257.1 transglutaminase family protein [Rhodospirillales bacterium]